MPIKKKNIFKKKSQKKTLPCPAVGSAMAMAFCVAAEGGEM